MDWKISNFFARISNNEVVPPLDNTAKATLLNCLWATALCKAHWYTYLCLLSLEQNGNHSAGLAGGVVEKKVDFLLVIWILMDFWQLKSSIWSPILLWTCFINFANFDNSRRQNMKWVFGPISELLKNHKAAKAGSYFSIFFYGHILIFFQKAENTHK